MSGLKSDFNTVKGFVKHPLQPIPGTLGLPTISTIDYQLAPIKPPSIIAKGAGSQSVISSIGSQYTIPKPPASALASLLKAWTF